MFATHDLACDVGIGRPESQVPFDCAQGSLANRFAQDEREGWECGASAKEGLAYWAAGLTS